MSRFNETAMVFLCTILVLAFSQSVMAKTYKVFLLGGQSNMKGSADSSDLPPELQNPQTNVLFYRESELVPLAPLNNMFGPEITFGRTVADAFPTENFALIKYAVSATDLHNDWDPTNGLIYRTFRTEVTNGLAELESGGDAAHIVGMLWTQGERDARIGRTAEQYQSDLIEFIADIRNRYRADLPFFLSRLSILQTNLPVDSLTDIRTAQTNVAAGDENVYMFDTDTFGLKDDNLHFDAAGQMSLGTAFGNAYIDIIFTPFVDIISTNATVPYIVSSYTISGSNNVNIAGMLNWTNNNTGSIGNKAIGSPAWTISGISLGIDDNVITVSGSNNYGKASSDSVTITRELPEPVGIIWIIVLIPPFIKGVGGI